MNPLEGANILILSQNHYDFRNECPDNVLDRLEPLSWEKMKSTNNPKSLFRPKQGHYDVMTPLEAAKILIFSHNHYDFRNQRPENVLDRLETLSLEKMKSTNPNPFKTQIRSL